MTKRTKVEPIDYCKMVVPHLNEFKAKHEYFELSKLKAFLQEKGLQLSAKLPGALVRAKVIKRDNTFKKFSWANKEPIMYGQFVDEVKIVLEKARQSAAKSIKNRIGMGVAVMDEKYAIKYLKERGYKILKPLPIQYQEL